MLRKLKKFFTRVSAIVICTVLVACSSDAQSFDTQNTADKKLTNGFYVKSGEILKDLEVVEGQANQIVIKHQILSSHPPNNSPEAVDENAHVTISYNCEGKCFDGEYSIFKEIMDSAFTIPCEMMSLEAKISLSKKGKPLWSIYLASTKDRLHYNGQCYRLSHDPMPIVIRGGILVWKSDPIKYDAPIQ